MKKLITLFTIIALIGCKNTGTKPETQEEQTTKEVVEQTEKEEGVHGDHTNVVLDNGKKWKANPETSEGIKNMQKIMNNFSVDSDLKAYQQLKTDLETEFTLIFQRCTMKGESHEQLHNYLKPMIEWFDGFESSEQTTRENSFDTLKKHLNTYSQYFE